MYIYRSYYKNKLGGPFFWNTLYTLPQLVADMDDKLFENILQNSHHVLRKLLPD